MWLVFVETPIFSQLRRQYLDDAGYRELQWALMTEPEAGAVMPGTGGFRKLRWPDRRRGKGKRGGLRVIYYYLTANDQIWFFTIFAKDEIADLTPGQKKALKRAIQTELAVRGMQR